MRKLATVRTIAELRTIPNADRIEVAQVDGWECVVKKGEFTAGDPIVYVEVDSIVPERPEFEFLRDRKFCVRTIKLRKQVSQGLVLPMSILPDGKEYNIGDDVTDILGIKKYDPQAEQELHLLSKIYDNQRKGNAVCKYFMRFAWFRKRFGTKRQKRGFPDWIVKTDEERIQNKTEMFELEKRLGTHFCATEKIDGQSATYFLEKKRFRRYNFGVCSRNVRLGKPDNSSYWSVAEKFHMQDVLCSLIDGYDRVVLQGEIIGPGIQKNKYQRSDYDFYAFNLIYPDGKIPTEAMRTVLSKYGIQTVPTVCEDIQLKDTIADMVEFSKGSSVLLPSQKREGVVMRNYEKNISFKIINPDFLLANDG